MDPAKMNPAIRTPSKSPSNSDVRRSLQFHKGVHCGFGLEAFCNSKADVFLAILLKVQAPDEP